MGTKPHVESVIARLMSLDEQQPLHPIHKQQSVLSENYILKTASVGLREGSLFSIGNSRRVSSGQLKGIKDTSELQISKDQCGTLSVNDKSANLSTKKLKTDILKLLPGPRSKNGEIFSKKSKWHAPGNVLKSVQKVENDSLTGHCGELGLDHLKDFLKYQLEILDRSYHSSTMISALKSNSTINKTDFRHIRSCLHPRPGYRDRGESLKAENGKLHNGAIYEEQVSNDYNVSRSATTSGLSSCNLSWLGLNNNNPEAYSKGIQDAKENSSEKENRCEDIEHLPRVSKLSNGHVASRCTVETKLENPPGISSTINKDKNSEQNPGIFSLIDAHYSDFWDAVTQQELSNEFIEEEFHETLNGVNQYSPDSVLSPHEVVSTSTLECFESVATDFDSIFESEETHSGGSETAVLSDKDMKESDDLSQDGRILQWSFGYEESRDFSYLLDVLDEAGFDHADLVDLSKTFSSQEYPVSPLVFKALEKKYSKLTLWRKSERKLLFDRINSGLKEIITIPLIDFDKYAAPVRRWFSTTLDRNEVEEELWQYLIIQDKEKNEDLSEKVLGKEMTWFELEDDVNIIVRELERFLFDELAIELVCRDDE